MILKICFFGLGSIGIRHLKNLRYIEKMENYSFEIHAFRSKAYKSNDDVPIDFIDKEIFEENNLDFYDVIFITNPTIMHFNTIKDNISKTKNMFIEKPIFHTSKVNIEELDFREDGIYYVAAPLRFNPVIRYIKENVLPEEVISARVICSSFLPEWRKGRNYKENYSAKKEMGGGVSLDLIHEIDYIRYLFGDPLEVVNFRKKVSNLEIDSEDLSVYILGYSNRIVELHLDYFGRFPRREIEIFLNDEIMIGDLINNKIKFLTKKEEICFPAIDIYIKEMKYFIDSINNKRKTYNEYDEAYKTLKICEGR